MDALDNPTTRAATMVQTTAQCLNRYMLIAGAAELGDQVVCELCDDLHQVVVAGAGTAAVRS